MKKNFDDLTSAMSPQSNDRITSRAKAILDRLDGPIQHVKQEHTYGCAIAAIAMVARLTYAEVLARLGPHVERLITKQGGGFWADLVFIALQRLGYAIALEWRAEWGRPRPDWKPEPICEVNVAEVMTPLGGHMIVVLGDRSVLDPAMDAASRSLGDYHVNWIAGVVVRNE